ncbi:MAG: radical SAM protein [Thermodesulfovibrionaceae bacterium]
MNLTKYYLEENFFIKLIDFPAIYNIKTDELYSINEKALEILKEAQQSGFAPAEEIDSELREFLNFCLNEGIFKVTPTKRRNPSLRQSPIPSLRYLELQITKRCNLKCKHCFVGQSKPIDLPFEKIKRVLTDFEELQGLRVLITGGEPLLHPEFDKINDFIKDIALRKILFTNGTLIDERLLSKLNVHELQISLDGMEQGHEALRGSGTFEKTLSAIKKAKDFNFDVSVATVIHKENLNEFEELEALIKDLNVREWIVDALSIKGNLDQNKMLWVLPEIAGKIMSKYGFTLNEHPKVEEYGCGAHLLCILANGEATFCSLYDNESLGSVDEGLESLWRRKNQFLVETLECYRINCPFLKECRGGCRFRATTLSNRLDAPDLFKCYQFGRLLS